MTSLRDKLSAAGAAAFNAIGLDAKWGEAKRSDKPEFADFQCNGAMGAAKQAGRPPREIAAEVAAHLKTNELVASAEIGGPGFINIRVTDAALSAQAEHVRTDTLRGASKAQDPQVTVIDFGGPNVAKPMHVGHLRSAVIGDTLQRLLRFLGDDVTSDTHLGDWGLQMGHLITELYDEQPGLVYFDESYTGPYDDTPPVTIDDLGRLYPAASAKANADPERNARSQMAVAELQAGRPGYRALLKHFIDVSVAALKVDYAFLNVSFDLWKGESDVDHLIAGLISDFKAKGLSKTDDGAVIVDIAREGENIPVEKDGQVRMKNAMPPIMLLNSRGGTGYHTTDLATIKDRMENMTPTPERMLYVVDQRQAMHFEQVYRAAGMLGLIDADRLEHIGFGTVNGPDGKPFKTREGGVLRLSDLNAMAVSEAKKKLMRRDADTGRIIVAEGIMSVVQDELRRKKYKSKKETIQGFLDSLYGLPSGHDVDISSAVMDENSPTTRRVLKVIQKTIRSYANIIALSAIRFADLQNTRTTNYVFDLDRFTSFEGKTGPYLLYAAVRVKSLLRRAAEEGNAPGGVQISSDAERALVLAMDGFGDALLGARAKRMPHILCEHIYNLAQAFSAFYGAHPIAAEPDVDIRASRLALSDAALKQLECGLDILGIDVPDRM